MPRRKPTVSTAAIVRDYIDTHPSIKDGMRMGISQELAHQFAMRPTRPARARAAVRSLGGDTPTDVEIMSGAFQAQEAL